MFKGVSLAGADFGESNLPGVFGTDYTYPNQDEVDYYKSKNMNIIRLPFRWERLQPTMNQAFDSAEFARLDEFVTQATAKNMYVLLDPHNYARYYGNLIGSSQVPNSAFADFWSRLANEYKDNSHVIFGLINEPHTMPTEQWISAANAAAAAIRNTGATNLITVPGNAWTGAHSWNHTWYGTANATALLDFVDPGNNFVVEVHQYFDSDFSGTSEQCVVPDASEVLSDFTSWLAANNLRGFLGEFSGASNDDCRMSVESALQYIDNNREHWIGWTWWAGGPWWTWESNILVIEPTADGREAPQMSWLEPYLP
ncbi:MULTISPECIES: glycoside hydrolase family 5 protein [unclassified Microbulbifer]|uniref:glycoside hydrolase family 5 protein n=1 Tax=unclassified Microbulbifer TaxID=2619833 RepID=UPI0027E4EE96|nr:MULTISPECIES: glycoside hydrolase family 5 protein [unclassified Microbulbifer]